MRLQNRADGHPAEDAFQYGREVEIHLVLDAIAALGKAAKPHTGPWFPPDFVLRVKEGQDELQAVQEFYNTVASAQLSPFDGSDPEPEATHRDLDEPLAIFHVEVGANGGYIVSRAPIRTDAGTIDHRHLAAFSHLHELTDWLDQNVARPAVPAPVTMPEAEKSCPCSAEGASPPDATAKFARGDVVTVPDRPYDKMTVESVDRAPFVLCNWFDIYLNHHRQTFHQDELQEARR